MFWKNLIIKPKLIHSHIVNSEHLGEKVSTKLIIYTSGETTHSLEDLLGALHVILIQLVHKFLK